METPDPAAPFAPIEDINLESLRGLANIFQHTLKVDEQKAKINTTTEMKPAATSTEAAPSLRVVEETSVLRVQEPAQTEVAPQYAGNHPTNIPFEDREYVRSKVGGGAHKTLHQKLHRYRTRQQMWIHNVYEELGRKKWTRNIS